MIKYSLWVLTLLMVAACSTSALDTVPPRSAEATVVETQLGDETPRPHPPQVDCQGPETAADFPFGPSMAIEATLIPDRAKRLEGDLLVTPVQDVSVLWGDVTVPPAEVHTAFWSLPGGHYVILLRSDGGDVYYPAGGPVGLYRVGDDDLLYMQCPASFSGGELVEAEVGVTRETLVSLLK